MICVVEMDKGSTNINPQPRGWIIAADIDDARRQAQSFGDTELAQWLYQQFELRPGKYDLPERAGCGQIFILVS